MIQDVYFGSRIQDPDFFHPVSLVQGSKKHRIPDPDRQLC
jgi:hypothetical protein